MAPLGKHVGESAHWVKVLIDDFDNENIFQCEIVCSKCGYYGEQAYNFCPWCGAEMNGELEVKRERGNEKNG